MLYWECKQRLAQLQEFRVLTFDYFQNIQMMGWASGGAPPRMNDKAQMARQQMNEMLQEVSESLDLMKIPHVVWYQPVRAGEFEQFLNVIQNVFVLYEFHIGSERVFDCTDRAIGAYQNQCKKLFRKNFNPFYWLGLLIVWLLRLPFRLLGAAGFNANKIEDSVIGKLFKLAVALAAFIEAILVMVDHWALIHGFLSRCAALLHLHL